MLNKLFIILSLGKGLAKFELEDRKIRIEFSKPRAQHEKRREEGHLIRNLLSLCLDACRITYVQYSGSGQLIVFSS